MTKRERDFKRVLTALREHDHGQDIEDLLRPPGKGGRPRKLPLDVFLAACIMTIHDKKRPTLLNVHEFLTEELGSSLQRELGVHGLTVRQVRYVMEALDRRLAHTPARVPDLDADARDTRQLQLQSLADWIVRATVPDDIGHPAAYAIDTTAVPTWGRRHGAMRIDRNADHAGDAKGRRDEYDDVAEYEEDREERSGPSDPDARFGYRTPTQRTGNTKIMYGYHGLAVAGVPAVGADSDCRPKLVESVTLRPANASAVEPTMAALDALEASQRAAREILVDREFSYKVAKDWAIPLRERGVEQVFDLHPKDRGARDFEGIKFVDGWPHCPGMPDHLVDIPRPPRFTVGKATARDSAEKRERRAANAEALDQFKALIAEREVFAFVRNSGPDQNGREQFICPAQAGKVRCPNCPLSMLAPDDVPVVENPPELPAEAVPPTPPARGARAAERAAYKQARSQWNTDRQFLKCCRQRTVVVPGHVEAKRRQRYRWGSDEWIAAYGRRTHVEGFFGNMANGSVGNVHHGWVHVSGIVKTTVMWACAAALTNIKALRSWFHRRPDGTSSPLARVGEPLTADETAGLQGGPTAHAPPT